jgi:hypothetical protein
MDLPFLQKVLTLLAVSVNDHLFEKISFVRYIDNDNHYSNFEWVLTVTKDNIFILING